MQRLPGAIIICFLLTVSSSYASKQPIIHVSVNARRTVIGHVIGLKISVEADKNARVSWQLCDELFKQSQQVTLLRVNSTAAGGYFQHIIAFTSVKPTHLSITALPVIVNTGKFLSPPVSVDFKSDRLPLAIHDIKPIRETNWSNLINAVTKVGLVLVILLLALATIYSILVKRITTPAPSILKQNCLKKLSALELVACHQGVTAAIVINQVSDLLSEFLQTEITFSGQRSEISRTDYCNALFDNIRETANRLKFLPQSAATLIYPSFISDIREFIINYKPVLSR